VQRSSACFFLSVRELTVAAFARACRSTLGLVQPGKRTYVAGSNNLRCAFGTRQSWNWLVLYLVSVIACYSRLAHRQLVDHRQRPVVVDALEVFGLLPTGPEGSAPAIEQGASLFSAARTKANSPPALNAAGRKPCPVPTGRRIASRDRLSPCLSPG
jgi:hypothetical protein